MNIKIYQEKDASYGVRIQLGKNIIYAVWDTLEDLKKDIQNATECAFDKLPPKNREKNKSILEMFYSPMIMKHAA